MGSRSKFNGTVVAKGSSMTRRRDPAAARVRDRKRAFCARSIDVGGTTKGSAQRADSCLSGVPCVSLFPAWHVETRLLAVYETAAACHEIVCDSQYRDFGVACGRALRNGWLLLCQ
jgi:hypothetical protein